MMFRMSEQDFNKIVRTEIRVQMVRRDISGRKLARQLGWSTTRLHRRLSGETPISATDLQNIAVILDVPVETLGFQLVTTAGHGIR